MPRDLPAGRLSPIFLAHRQMTGIAVGGLQRAGADPMSALTPAERQEMIEELISFWHESELEFARMTDAELANEYAGMIEVQGRRP